MNQPTPTSQPAARREVSVLAVTRKPQSPSFAQRVLRYVEPLRERGVHVSWREIPRSPLGLRRLLGEARRYDAVWWHRHMLPAVFGGWLEGVGRPVVFDFDDPLPFSSTGEQSRTRARRFAGMLRRCRAAMAASTYLRDLATPLCPRVEIVPMAVDLPALESVPAPRAAPIELLWLGSAATQPYLELIRPALEQLGAQRRDVKLRLVAHAPLSFAGLAVDFRRWSEQEQALGLRECHVGLCPMPDTPWTRGKCPYKVLQYMAHRMAWIGSAVGENLVMAGPASATTTITDAAAAPRGRCVADTAQWVAALARLIEDAALRQRLGTAGRAYVERYHSRQALVDRLAGLWRQWG